MALSTDVKLHRAVVPVWPERCVGCGAASPTNRVRFHDRSTTWLSTLLMQFAPKVTVTAPACRSCAPRLARGHWIEKVLMVITVSAGALLGHFFVAGYFPRWLHTIVVIVCALVAYAPVVTWRIFAAPEFSIQAWDDEIDYQFLDEAYAREFAELNGGKLS